MTTLHFLAKITERLPVEKVHTKEKSPKERLCSFSLFPVIAKKVFEHSNNISRHTLFRHHIKMGVGRTGFEPVIFAA